MYGNLVDMTYFQINNTLKHLRNRWFGNNTNADEIVELIKEYACLEIINSIYLQELPSIAWNYRLCLFNAENMDILNAFIVLVGKRFINNKINIDLTEYKSKFIEAADVSKIHHTVKRDQILTFEIRKYMINKERMWEKHWDFNTLSTYQLKEYLDENGDRNSLTSLTIGNLLNKVPANATNATTIYKIRNRNWYDNYQENSHLIPKPGQRKGRIYTLY